MSSEAITRFDCFGGSCAVLVTGAGPAGRAPEAVARARRRLQAWHDQFSRFAPDSELSRLNHDPDTEVGVSLVMAKFAQAAVGAARATRGLVDPTLVSEIEAAGYLESRSPDALALDAALELAPPRAPAGPRPQPTWPLIEVDVPAGTVTRPPGVSLDSGGIAKGLFGDILASALEGHESFAVDGAGDVRFGGRGGALRPIQVAGPFDGSVVHVFELRRGAAATSGIGRRSWIDPDGRAAHHLLDPATGRPAFTGLVQVTALAPTGVRAETLSKAALLSGPEMGRRWLPHGGVLVHDDGRIDVIDAADDAPDGAGQCVGPTRRPTRPLAVTR